MPLEIRELVIKAQVGNEMNSDGSVERNDSSYANQEEVVKQCVEKVLEIIKEKMER